MKARRTAASSSRKSVFFFTAAINALTLVFCCSCCGAVFSPSASALFAKYPAKILAEVTEIRKEYKELYGKFGLNVVFDRKRKKLTQLQLAELVDIDRSHISAIELGNVGVSFSVIFKPCEVLEITPKELFDFRD